MGSLKDDFGDRSRGTGFSGIDLHDFERQCIADVQIHVWKTGFLPTPRVSQLNRIEGLAVVEEPDPFDATKILEAALRVDASVGDVHSIKWRPVKAPRKVCWKLENQPVSYPGARPSGQGTAVVQGGNLTATRIAWYGVPWKSTCQGASSHQFINYGRAHLCLEFGNIFRPKDPISQKSEQHRIGCDHVTAYTLDKACGKGGTLRKRNAYDRVVENLIGDPAFPYPFPHASKHSFGLEEINRYCIRWAGIVDGSGINGEKKFDAKHLQWHTAIEGRKSAPRRVNRDLLEFGDRVKPRSLRKCHA